MRVIVLLSFMLLAACGQSGDLYLPPEQPEQPVADTPPADEDKQKEAPKGAP